MKKRAVIFLLFLCGLNFTLFGYRQLESIQFNSSAVAATEAQSHFDESSTENPTMQQTLHMELEQNLTIDAPFPALDSSDLALPVLRGRRFQADAHRIQQIFFPNATILNEISYPDYPDHTSLELEDEKYISVGPGTISVITEKGEVITQLYALEWILNEETLAQPDLQFAGRDAVIEQTLSALAEIGLRNVQCKQAYALSAVQLQNASDDLLSQPDYAEDIRENRIAFQEKWLPDDECYVLKMQFIMDDSSLPVFSDESAKAYSFTEIHYENYELETVVSKEGIISFKAFRAIECIDSERSEKIIPFENVAELLANYYQNIIIQRPTVICEIALNYIILPVDGSNTYELIPAWCCKAVAQNDSAEGSSVNWIVFNAMTGEVQD